MDKFLKIRIESTDPHVLYKTVSSHLFFNEDKPANEFS